ncbi:TetR/AcrR family transcriptional regulator [Hymenobacter jeollabukensis]|uniref:TetR/AcrR family transcriptional regulator n=1 Tax=Hymenobacter jeollabukensis TaxID=2025313 RepID=A0A5R8WXQ7_9BACT|nr:TetR/AcrR family transcriptional regulator [Hymenobacter jeollabukensis]TLM96984.1 TetR/AcrR family transcriptional regulator [Hymenobacter jeollabukensis]
MGIADRKLREKTERRQAILDAALHLFTQQGFEKVSMRNIADTIEYSPATIYLYFKDKNELLLALQTQGFELLVRELGVITSIEHPAEQLRAVGEQFLGFAFRHPELFELMFIMSGPMVAAQACAGANAWPGGGSAFAQVVGIVQRGIDKGVFRPQNAESAALMVWAQVHGLAALHLRQRLVVLPEERRLPAMQEALTLFYDLIRRAL